MQLRARASVGAGVDTVSQRLYPHLAALSLSLSFSFSLARVHARASTSFTKEKQTKYVSVYTAP